MSETDIEFIFFVCRVFFYNSHGQKFLRLSTKGQFRMPKITFMGAGSTIFVRHIIGDCMLCESLRDSHVALYDIDAERLK